MNVAAILAAIRFVLPILKLLAAGGKRPGLQGLIMLLEALLGDSALLADVVKQARAVQPVVMKKKR